MNGEYTASKIYDMIGNGELSGGELFQKSSGLDDVRSDVKRLLEASKKIVIDPKTGVFDLVEWQMALAVLEGSEP